MNMHRFLSARPARLLATIDGIEVGNLYKRIRILFVAFYSSTYAECYLITLHNRIYFPHTLLQHAPTLTCQPLCTPKPYSLTSTHPRFTRSLIISVLRFTYTHTVKLLVVVLGESLIRFTCLVIRRDSFLSLP